MTTNHHFSQTAAFIWSVADLLRGDFQQSQYGRVILPFTLLRRLECVLAPSKEAVLAECERMTFDEFIGLLKDPLIRHLTTINKRLIPRKTTGINA